jgi:hypothetical protein
MKTISKKNPNGCSVRYNIEQQSLLGISEKCLLNNTLSRVSGLLVAVAFVCFAIVGTIATTQEAKAETFFPPLKENC